MCSCMPAPGSSALADFCIVLDHVFCDELIKGLRILVLECFDEKVPDQCLAFVSRLGSVNRKAVLYLVRLSCTKRLTGLDHIPVFDDAAIGIGTEDICCDPLRCPVIQVLVHLQEHEGTILESTDDLDFALRVAEEEVLENSAKPTFPSFTPVLCCV